MVVVADVVVVGAGVLGRCTLKEFVYASNLLLLHDVLYWLHNCFFPLYEILWHFELTIHACWHASKLDCCPEDWLSFTSPLFTLQMPFQAICVHEYPMPMIDTSTS